MSGIDPTPLFVDTGPFYARFDTDDEHHERTVSIFEGIRTGDYLYRPVYTSRYILAETTRLLLQNVGHEAAITALNAIRQGELFTVRTVHDELFERACEQFEQYDDQEITLVDHLSGVLAEEQDVTHVFTLIPTTSAHWGSRRFPATRERPDWNRKRSHNSGDEGTNSRAMRRGA